MPSSRAECMDDPGCQCPDDAQGVAHGEDQLADTQGAQSPMGAARKSLASTCSAAKSHWGSRAAIAASRTRPSESVTVADGPRTTWALVIINPVDRQMTPDPRPRRRPCTWTANWRRRSARVSSSRSRGGCPSLCLVPCSIPCALPYPSRWGRSPTMITRSASTPARMMEAPTAVPTRSGPSRLGHQQCR